jgi:maltose alpha-D-glucosyltransferase/alpha-amylase
MLQSLVANEGDGWAWFLGQLCGFYERAASEPNPPGVAKADFASAAGSPVNFAELADSTMQAAALLGRRSAELHVALSSSSDIPAFAPEPTSASDLETDARQIELQIRSAMEALKSRFTALDDAISEPAGLLLSRRGELLERSRSIAQLPPVGKRIRIHGDYHLGQTLRVADAGGSGDFVLLDFEGEPARPLSERRRKQSPLRDVAGMLRSFSYAAFAGMKQHLRASPESAEAGRMDRLQKWAQAWHNYAAGEFLAAYRETIGARPDLLPVSRDTQKLLDGYVLEKALYELLYELNNRPAWVHIPLAGILSL